MNKVKEVFEDLRRIIVAVEFKKEKVESLRSMAEYRTPTFDGVGGGSFDPHKNEALIAKAVDLANDIECSIDKLLDLERVALEMIDCLSDSRAITIFDMRYFKNITWEEIADTLNISFQWVHSIHREGLKEIEKKYEKIASL